MYEVQLHNTGQIFQWYLRFCRSLIYQALHEQQKLFIQPDQESRQNKCPISMQTGMEGWEKCSGQERSTWSSFDSLPSPRQVVSISAAVTPKSTSPRWQKLQATRQLLNINMVQRICSAAVMSRAEQKKKKKIRCRFENLRFVPNQNVCKSICIWPEKFEVLCTYVSMYAIHNIEEILKFLPLSTVKYFSISLSTLLTPTEVKRTAPSRRVLYCVYQVKITVCIMSSKNSF